MDQPAGQSDFRLRLQAALAEPDTRARLDGLARLAHSRPGLIETIQLDRALVGSAAESIDGYASVRLAVLSNNTIDHLLPAIRVAGLRYGLRLEVFSGSYGQYRQELLDPASPLVQFRPDLILLSLSARRETSGVPIAATAEEVEQTLAEAIGELRELWRHARSVFNATVIQQSYLDVSEPLFGSYDRLVPAAPSRLITRLNDLLACAVAQENVMLLDVAQASARDGIDAWFDVARWLQGKMEIAPQAAPRYGELIARLIGAQRGKSRKCLVLDLDDTLWGGVVGEVGIAGIILGEGSPQGEAHLALQRYAKLLKDRGVILAVCSKNEQALTEQAFREHPEMVLRRSDLAAFVANWNDKVENLKDIAERLNIGLDSLVFVDDNPVERARVREALPMVAVPELPNDPALYVHSIANAGYFEAVNFTADDLRRGEQYATNAEREALRGVSQSVDDFLRGLGMSVTYGGIEPVDFARATQLINKTNQFNTTTRRYSSEEVARLVAAPQNLTLQFRLADRFGDNGLVSVMILRPAGEPGVLDVDTWVMSCRVFGRQLENEIMSIAVEAAQGRGVRVLRADYVPTERNGVVSGLFRDLGFAAVPGTEPNGASGWILNTAEYVARPTFIARRAAHP
ncbi:MAG TPA: HAD-IIIC family phosphatase [Burkholderiales bacterium]|nr:HAD-IIIC family phosphatase [Burkholderiales bacterium]